MQMADARTRIAAAAIIALATLTTSCIVETPGIDSTQQSDQPTAVPQPTATAAVVQFEPTPAVTPIVEPTATAVPEPTPTATPPGPTPLPTSAPAPEFEPTAVEPGLIAIPVRSAQFMLAQTRPILQLGGHTLIYVDDERNAEVDIFIPAAAADGTAIDSYEVLITYLESNTVFAELLELPPISIAGIPTRVFEGTANSAERAFITEVGTDNDQYGWFPPARMRLWVIDHPEGPVIVSAESLENPGRYSDAVRLATEVLSTIAFG